MSCSNKDKVEPIKNTEYSLVLDKQDEDIVIGEELIITLTINNNAQALTYIWTSSDNTVATVSKNNDNSATVKTLSIGKAIIKVECVENKNLSATCTVNVTERTFRILAISKPSMMETSERRELSVMQF